VQEGQVVDNNLAGKGSQEVVPALKLPQLLEATNSGDFSYEVLIF